MKMVERENKIRAGGKTATSATLTRTLLACGALVAPVFMGVGIVQILTRPGFDIRPLAISSLSLGDLGWIQIANFEKPGLLAFTGAAAGRRGLRGGRGGPWGPVLAGRLRIRTSISRLFYPHPTFVFLP